MGKGVQPVALPGDRVPANTRPGVFGHEHPRCPVGPDTRSGRRVARCAARGAPRLEHSPRVFGHEHPDADIHSMRCRVLGALAQLLSTRDLDTLGQGARSPLCSRRAPRFER